MMMKTRKKKREREGKRVFEEREECLEIGVGG
jgi:hypothetical protein